MTTPLSEQFREDEKNGNRIVRLQELMNACEHRYRVIPVMVIGCGDAFINRYWPELVMLLNQGKIKLTLVDRGSINELIKAKFKNQETAGEKEQANYEKLQMKYDGLQSVLQSRQKDIRYLDIEVPRDQNEYFHSTQDIIFVLVPDSIHVKYASDWLRRSTLIIVEKPYNENLTEAQNFEMTLVKITKRSGESHPYSYVVCIDHFLAKIFDWVMRRSDDYLQEQIGIIRKIEFSICEAGGVEPWRAETLKAGMVYDLFSHILAQISPLVDLESFDTNQYEIYVSQHKDPAYSSDTFFSFDSNYLLDYRGNNIKLSGVGGKGIGLSDKKFLKIIGENGTLEADFSPQSSGRLCLMRGEGSTAAFKIGKGHPEIIDSIFNGEFIRKPVGGLTGKMALQILKILTSIREKIPTNLESNAYAIGTEAEEIKKNAVRIV